MTFPLPPGQASLLFSHLIDDDSGGNLSVNVDDAGRVWVMFYGNTDKVLLNPGDRLSSVFNAEFGGKVIRHDIYVVRKNEPA